MGNLPLAKLINVMYVDIFHDLNSFFQLSRFRFHYLMEKPFSLILLFCIKSYFSISPLCKFCYISIVLLWPIVVALWRAHSCPVLSTIITTTFFFHVSVCPWELAAPSKPIMVIIVLWPERLAAQNIYTVWSPKKWDKP